SPANSPQHSTSPNQPNQAPPHPTTNHRNYPGHRPPAQNHQGQNRRSQVPPGLHRPDPDPTHPGRGHQAQRPTAYPYYRCPNPQSRPCRMTRRLRSPSAGVLYNCPKLPCTFYTGEYCADYSHPTRPSPSPHQPDRTWHHPNPRCTRHGPFSSQQDCPESAENSPPGHATPPQYASSHPRPDPSDHTSASTT